MPTPMISNEKEATYLRKLNLIVEWSDEQYAPFQKFADTVRQISENYTDIFNQISDIQSDVRKINEKISNQAVTGSELTDEFEIPYQKFLKLKKAFTKSQELNLHVVPPIPENHTPERLVASEGLLIEHIPAKDADDFNKETFHKAHKLILLRAEKVIACTKKHAELKKHLPELELAFNELKSELKNIREVIQILLDREIESAQQSEEHLPNASSYLQHPAFNLQESNYSPKLMASKTVREASKTHEDSSPSNSSNSNGNNSNLAFFNRSRSNNPNGKNVAKVHPAEVVVPVQPQSCCTIM